MLPLIVMVVATGAAPPKGGEVRLEAGTRPGETVMMPAMGLGTGGYGGAGGGGEWWNDTMVPPIITEWLKRGGRRIDTAYGYATEIGIGKAVKAALADGLITREELFVTSKTDVGKPGPSGSGGTLPPHLVNDSGYEWTLYQGRTILNNTGLDYVDLILLHWPGNAGVAPPMCSSASGSQKECRQNSWRALQKLLADGATRAIGVSNFEPHHIQDVLELGGVGPGVCQNEFHPYWHEIDLIEPYKKLGIWYQSYSPLGAPDHMAVSAGGSRNWKVLPAEQPAIVAVADKHKKSPAQVILKWAWQLGVTANPRTLNVTQMDENLEALADEWRLSDEDMRDITSVEGHGTAPPDECGVAVGLSNWTCANKVCPDPRAIK